MDSQQAFASSPLSNLEVLLCKHGSVGQALPWSMTSKLREKWSELCFPLLPWESALIHKGTESKGEYNPFAILVNSLVAQLTRVAVLLIP